MGFGTTDLLNNGKLVPHVGVFEDFAVTNGVDVDRLPLDVIAPCIAHNRPPCDSTIEQYVSQTV